MVIVGENAKILDELTVKTPSGEDPRGYVGFVPDEAKHNWNVLIKALVRLLISRPLR